MPGHRDAQHRYGLSYEQIGQRLGISTNMVKKYLSQAGALPTPHSGWSERMNHTEEKEGT